MQRRTAGVADGTRNIGTWMGKYDVAHGRGGDACMYAGCSAARHKSSA